MKNILSVLWFAFCVLFLLSCASTESVSQRQMSEGQIKRTEEEKIELPKKETQVETKLPELKAPELVPVKEDISPLQTKVVSISARNTPLRDILYTIAETANLNIVMERGIDPELPITITLKNLNVEDALNIIFDSADYFYSVKDNILIVKSMGTEIFEIGQPGVIQEYKTEVGGDILSGASSVEEGGGEGAIKGNVSTTSVSDKLSFQFWDAIENSLKTLFPTAGAGQEGTQQASFTVNRMTGTIIVTATKKDLKKVRDYVANLKKVLNRQVLVEARIVEVQLSEGLKYGIDWSFIEDWQGVGNINIKTAKFSSVVDTTGPNFQISVTGQNFTSVLSALQQQGDVKTLSNPRVNILNGQTAMLSVGRNTSFISSVETTTTSTEGTATTTYTVKTRSILSGIIFGLVPYINKEGEITLSITPIVSNLVSLDAKTIGTGGNTVEIKLPTVDLREMSTTVRILDGQMVIIGGLIDREEKLQENKVPILGDIPILGMPFKRVEKSYENTELVIMLIPKILNR